jgi:hypothetical protein
MAVPTITNIVPSPGFVGQTVTINGTNLIAGATVSFGGVAGASPTVISATQVTCVVPQLTSVPGTVSVTITTSGGTSTPATPWVFGAATSQQYYLQARKLSWADTNVNPGVPASGFTFGRPDRGVSTLDAMAFPAASAYAAAAVTTAEEAIDFPFAMEGGLSQQPGDTGPEAVEEV